MSQSHNVPKSIEYIINMVILNVSRLCDKTIKRSCSTQSKQYSPICKWSHILFKIFYLTFISRWIDLSTKGSNGWLDAYFILSPP